MKPTHKWMPVIDEDKCSGCGLCVSACGPACLGMRNALAVMTLPEACGSEEHCIGDTSRGKWQTCAGRAAPGQLSVR
jgi:Fe-S-cluster-containing hydrogenase component 2